MPTHNIPEHERANPLRRPAQADGPEADRGASQHPLLTLQRQIGNARIARMLAQREGAPEEDEGLVQAKHDPGLAQREGAPEEDEGLVQAKHDPGLAQREGAPEEDDESLMQAKPEVGMEGGPVSPDLAQRIEANRGSGAPLEEGTRTQMEGALGASFDHVRVHSDAESAQLNRSISAKAFTTGSDIFLGPGASPSDHSLMAHELTHVVQQQSMSSSGPLTVGPAGDSYEQQADASAAAVAAGAAAPTAQRSAEEEAG
ncbi:MAG: DUF4157 domain-containing protein [Kouleothrix sp.]|nr:DUF4157 domain-containing protein [Kouleothrix sp.]